MLIDKPPWVAHDKAGADLFCVDVCPDGARFATGGADNKVKVWALPPVLRAEAESGAAAPGGTPLLLATLPEHCGPVNALRFSRSGRRLASGSDDKLVLVHELRAGAPRPVFGSADPPAVENWVVRTPRRPAACAWRAALTRHAPAAPAVRAAAAGARQQRDGRGVEPGRRAAGHLQPGQLRVRVGRAGRARRHARRCAAARAAAFGVKP